MQWPRWGEMPRPNAGVPQGLKQASRENLEVWIQDSCQEGGSRDQGEQPLPYLSALEALSPAQPPRWDLQNTWWLLMWVEGGPGAQTAVYSWGSALDLLHHQLPREEAAVS